jgi:uncharacterized protein (DUF2236 family)
VATPNFPRGSVIRRVNVEPAIGLGAGRALMLQIAHEAVAQGVEDHSDFKGNPFTRLIGTLEAVYTMVFGSEDLARGVGERIQWIHGFVTGPTYAANDPANLMWVHATLTDTALRCYETYVEPLSAADRETYYQEMAKVAELFGCPRGDQPATYADFEQYVEEMVAKIDVTPIGRDLAAFILDPVLPLGLHVPLRPALRLQRRTTLGSLPVSIREQLGVRWTAGDQARHDRFERRARAVLRATPRPLRVAGTRAQGLVFLALARHHVRRFREQQAGASRRGPAA